MRVIVTGGAGFIGSNLVFEILERHPEAKIHVVDDFSSASFKNLTGFNGDVLARPCEEVNWEAQFGPLDHSAQKVSAIYHLASITDTTVTDQREMVERNVEGFRNVLRFALKRGIRVVYASSGATYGQADGVMREDQPPAPANVYGFSKMILDNLAREAAAMSNLPIVGVRYFNVYGPREAHKGKMASMVYQLYRQMTAGARPRVFQAGQHKRDFVYVKDAVAGTLLAGQCDRPGVFNIGSGAAFSFNEVIGCLNAALATSLEPEYIDNPYEAFYQHHTEADLTRANEVLGYRPQWLPAEGIRDYVDWLKG
ncbi:ADP-glyceromanno-heptose 6-epimerase [bacterium]|nr:ADP-glyceromanno-heptose 6-epimerase [bacterium]